VSTVGARSFEKEFLRRAEGARDREGKKNATPRPALADVGWGELSDRGGRNEGSSLDNGEEGREPVLETWRGSVQTIPSRNKERQLGKKGDC